jgi:peptidoglycan L-alanyl-D-glutamate endopeptidase CwlK
MASRSLKDLTPQCQLKAEQFLQSCSKAGIDILVYCTYRSKEEQDELYKIGRTLPGKIVTNARGGYSWHNHHRAFDWVPIVNGKPQWNNNALYSRAGIIAEQVGLEWSGRWTGKLKETAHCQYTEGKSIESLLKGDA